MGKRNPKGREGFTIGRVAAEDVYTEWKQNQLTNAQAEAIADEARNDTDMQRAGLTLAREQKLNGAQLRQAMRAMKQRFAREGEQEPGTLQQPDLFGEDDSARQELAKEAKAAREIQRELEKDRRDLNRALEQGRLGLQEADDLGITDPQDTEQIRQVRDRINDKLERMERWATDSELRRQVRDRAGLSVEQQPTAETEVTAPTEELPAAESDFQRYAKNVAQAEELPDFVRGTARNLLYQAKRKEIEDVAQARQKIQDALAAAGVQQQRKFEPTPGQQQDLFSEQQEGQQELFRAGQEQQPRELTNKERRKLRRRFKKMTGTSNVNFVNQLQTAEGQTATGRYWQQWVDIVQGNQSTETINHEAVHFAIDNLLSNQEKQDLLQPYRDAGMTDIQAEEQLAEDFVEYARRRTTATSRQTGMTLGERVRRMFERALQRLKRLLGISADNPQPRAAQQFFDALFTGSLADARVAGAAEGQARYTDQSERLGLYSPLEQAVEEMDFTTMPADQLAARIRKTSGVKQEELEDLGFFNWLEMQEGKVSKEAVLAFIREGGPAIEEVRKGHEEKDLTSYFQNNYSTHLHTLREEANLVPVREPAMTSGIGFKDQETGEIFSLFQIEDQVERFTGPALNAAREITAAAEDINLPEKVRSEAPEYEQYTLEGGDNYREILLTLPKKARGLDSPEAQKFVRRMDEKYGRETNMDDWTQEEQREFNRITRVGEDYRSSHWSEPNVLAHVRVNDRVDSEGNNVLFIEEIQSDWHQAGREKGYKGDEKLPEGVNIETYQQGGQTLYRARREDEIISGGYPSRQQVVNEVQGRQAQGERVPDAPFKKSWGLLAFKRMLRMAAEQGYDKVAWTTGQQQAERYNQAANIERIEVRPNQQENVQEVSIITDAQSESIRMDVSPDGTIPESGVPDYEGKNITEIVGKDMGRKILKADSTQTFEGGDLTLGGEGMKGFYDRILKNAVQKYTKKLDKSAKVATSEVETVDVQGWGIVDKNGNPVDDNRWDTRQQALAAMRQKGMMQEEGYSPQKLDVQTAEVWSLPITDKLRDEVLSGQPMYRQRETIRYRQPAETEEQEPGGTVVGEFGQQFRTDREVKSLWDNIKTWLNKYWRWGHNRHGTPADVSRALQEFTANEEATKHEFTKDSKRITKKLDTIEKKLKDADSNVRKTVEGVLKGEQAFAVLEQSRYDFIRDDIREAKEKIVDLQTAIIDLGIPPEQLEQVIEESKGRYVTRTYKKFEMPGYKPTTQQRQLAAEVIRDQITEKLQSKAQRINKTVARYKTNKFRKKLREYVLTGNEALLSGESKTFRDVASKLRGMFTAMKQEYNDQLQASLDENNQVTLEIPPEHLKGIVDGTLNHILKKDVGAPSAAEATPGKGPRQERGSFIRRKNIHPVIREFMGEIHDPAAMIQTTALRLSQMIHAYQFQQSIFNAQMELSVDHPSRVLYRTEYKNTHGAFDQQTPDDPAYGNLRTLWTNEETLAVIKNMGDPPNRGIAGRIQMEIVTRPRFYKVVLNPPTHLRNLMGSALFRVADGESVNRKQWKKGWGKAAPLIKGIMKDEKWANQEWERLIRSTVLKGAAHGETIRQDFQDKVRDIDPNFDWSRLDEMTEEEFDQKLAFWFKKFGRKVKRGRRNLVQAMTTAYGMEDNIPKILSYYSKMERYPEKFKAKFRTLQPGEAFVGLRNQYTFHGWDEQKQTVDLTDWEGFRKTFSINEITEQEVIERIRSAYPYYDEAPAAVTDYLRTSLIGGDFLTFFTESLRTGLNNWSNAWRDIKYWHDPSAAVGTIGAQSAAATKSTLKYSVPALGIYTLVKALGKEPPDDDEGRALKHLAPKWQYTNSTLSWKAKDGTYKTIDLGYLQPWAPQMRVSQAVQAPAGEKLSRLATGLARDVAGPPIAAKTLIHLAMNEGKYGHRIVQADDGLNAITGENWAEQLGAVGKEWTQQVAKEWGPSMAMELFHSIDLLRAKQDLTGRRGEKRTLSEHITAMFTPIRITTRDPRQDFSWKASSVADMMYNRENEARRAWFEYYNNKIRREVAVEKTETAREKFTSVTAETMDTYVDATLTLGVPIDEVRAIMDRAGFAEKDIEFYFDTRAMSPNNKGAFKMEVPTREEAQNK